MVHVILTRAAGISHPQTHYSTQHEQKTEWQKPNETRAQSAKFHAKSPSAYTKQVTKQVTFSKEETLSLTGKKNVSVRGYQDLQK